LPFDHWIPPPEPPAPLRVGLQCDPPPNPSLARPTPAGPGPNCHSAAASSGGGKAAQSPAQNAVRDWGWRAGRRRSDHGGTLPHPHRPPLELGVRKEPLLESTSDQGTEWRARSPGRPARQAEPRRSLGAGGVGPTAVAAAVEPDVGDRQLRQHLPAGPHQRRGRGGSVGDAAESGGGRCVSRKGFGGDGACASCFVFGVELWFGKGCP